LPWRAAQVYDAIGESARLPRGCGRQLKAGVFHLKVVLFCGGQGTRIREYSDQVPKPLVPIGGMPILWHIMKYYASYGHKDFILCLGYMGDKIKRFFLDYDECMSNDFVQEAGGRRRRAADTDVSDWRISFVDTGQSTNIGGRLLRVREHLEGEDMFLANYADVLTDLDINRMIAEFSATDTVAGFCCIRPHYSFHLVSMSDDGQVDGMTTARDAGMWMNGGYMVLRRSIFNYLFEGEELVVEGFGRLLKQRRLYAHKHEGFWMPMDTFKEKQALDEMVAEGDTPWRRWKPRPADADIRVA
jgi:glucose-1-phosphate cytidylyltransferase